MLKLVVFVSLFSSLASGCATLRHIAAPLEGSVLVAQGAYEAFRDYGKCDSLKIVGNKVVENVCTK